MQDLLRSKLSKELKENLEFYSRKYGYAVFPEMYVTKK